MLQEFRNVIVRVTPSPHHHHSKQTSSSSSSLVFSHASNNLLPIKPKPFLYPKDSTLLYDSQRNSKADQFHDAILVSEFFVHIEQVHLMDQRRRRRREKRLPFGQKNSTRPFWQWQVVRKGRARARGKRKITDMFSVLMCISIDLWFPLN